MLKLLFIIRRPPWPAIMPTEYLDMAMTAAAFEHTVNLLFMAEGVWQLQAGQLPPPQHQGRSSVSVWEALELYDINTLWVERESLQERGIDPAKLILPVIPVARDALSRLIQRHDRVVHD